MQDMHRSENSATGWRGHQNHNHSTDFSNDKIAVCNHLSKMTKKKNEMRLNTHEKNVQEIKLAWLHWHCSNN